MSANCGEILKFLEEVAPAALAEEWDNTGLLLGSIGQKVNRLMVCLDVTSKVVDEAIKNKTDLIVSHHPLIFKAISRINEENSKGKIIFKLIRNGIGVCCAHTNLDIADGGVNDCLASLLGLSNVKMLNSYTAGAGRKEAESDADLRESLRKECGPGRVGVLEKPVPLSDFVMRVKKALDVDYVRLIGDDGRMIVKAAVFSGSFDGNFSGIKRERADALVTGEVKYHEAVTAAEEGICIIEAGHYATEKIMVARLADMFKQKFPGIGVLCSASEKDPFAVV